MNPELQTRLLSALVGEPLLGNTFRGTLVEAMVSLALEPEWRWCAKGWASYDFESAEGIGLEVKQSLPHHDRHAT